MKPTEIIHHLNSIGARLHLKGDKLLCEAPKGVIAAELLAEIKANKPALILLLTTEQSAKNNNGSPPFSTIAREDSHPLSFAQRRMILLHSMQAQSAAFNLSLALELDGILDTNRLEEGLQEMAKQQELLRTSFSWKNGEPVQMIHPPSALKVQCIDLSQSGSSFNEDHVHKIIESERQTPFDIGQAPLFRLTLLRKSTRSSILLLVSHHLIADERSLILLTEELSDQYNKQQANLSTAAVTKYQYVDYVHWEMAFAQSPAGKQQIHFWTDRLGKIGLETLQKEHHSDHRQRFQQSGEEEFELSWETTAWLQKITQEQSTSLSMLCYAIYTILIASAYKCQHFCCSTPIVNRSRMETENMIGYFANTLVLDCLLPGDQSFTEYLGSVRTELLAAMTNADIPFELNLQQSGTAAGPLTRWMFTYGEDEQENFLFAALPARRLQATENISQNIASELSLFAVHKQQRLKCSLLYARDLLSETDAECLSKHFKTIAQRLVNSPQSTISELTIGCNCSLAIKAAEKQIAPVFKKPVQKHPTTQIEQLTKTEKQLFAIWAKVLRSNHFGVHDNFFQLGGQSMQAIQVTMQAGKIGKPLKPQTIFQHPTIAQLAAIIDQNGVRGELHTDSRPQGKVPLTPAQIRFLDERKNVNPNHWNFSALLQANQLQPDCIKKTLCSLLAHHDALRLRLSNEKGTWHQEIGEPQNMAPFHSFDIAKLEPQQQRTRIALICEKLQNSLDLANGPCFQVAHFDCGDQSPDRLFFTLHHFIIDAFSWEIFLEDFQATYLATLSGQPSGITLKTDSFRQWSMRLREFAETPEVQALVPQWLNLPWDKIDHLPLDFDTPPGANTNASAEDVELLLEVDNIQAPITHGEALRVEEVILTALAQALAEWTQSKVIHIDCLNHGRTIIEDMDLSRTVGFMICYQPVVLHINNSSGLQSILDSSIKQLRELPQGFTFDLLRLFSNDDPKVHQDISSLPRAEVLFNFTWELKDSDPESSSLFSYCSDPCGSSHHPQNNRYHPLAISVAMGINGLSCKFAFSRHLHKRSSIELLSACFRTYLLELNTLLAR